MTTVVLADDQELIRVGLKVMLETRGIQVLAEASNGREAIAQVRRHRPDVVLMDVRMPVLDGIAATEAIVAEGLPSARVRPASCSRTPRPTGSRTG